LGDQANEFTSDPASDAEASAIIQAGQDQQTQDVLQQLDVNGAFQQASGIDPK
jgi:hypothetical protein